MTPTRDEQSEAASAFFSCGEPGPVVWITGLPGTGKTTIGRGLYTKLREAGEACVYLDGDSIREACGHDLGYTPEDRLANALRICRMCQMLSLQGLTVVCATVSLYQQCHRWSREHHARYVEVLVTASAQVLRERDQKGLYSRAEREASVQVPGLDQPFDYPEAPDLVLHNDRGDLGRAIDSILTLLHRDPEARPGRPAAPASDSPAFT